MKTTIDFYYYLPKFFLLLDDHDTPKKPSQSYLEIIAEAILKAPNRMMQLYEIYNYFQRKYIIFVLYDYMFNETDLI